MTPSVVRLALRQVLVVSSGLAVVACRPAAPPPSAPAAARVTAPPAPVAPVAPQRLAPAEIAARATPSVCAIRVGNLLGTGFVVDGSGIIATNLHVLGALDAPAIVTLADKRELPILEIVAFSERHDLALVRVDGGAPGSFPRALTLGDSEHVRAGDAVVAIGHPLGFDYTVSNGLVSAIRPIDAELTVLQISAPIAPGSSGGPLFDEQGEVVGVSTAIVRGGSNLGFGVPVRYVKDLLARPSPVAPSVLRDRLALQSAEQRPPAPRGSVPHHEIPMLDGCGPTALHDARQAIGGAIEVGAPLYNNGEIAACYHVYEGAARDLEHRLPPACKGPRRALALGRANAAKLVDPAEQAWAMRDAFDGVLDVIARKAASEHP